MPLITVKYSTPLPASGLVPAIANAITRFASEVLGKDPKVTAAVVEEVATANWFAGGRSLAEQKLASFALEIRVTEGTNTKDEISYFISQVFAFMGRLLGPMHEESYIHVIEARGHAYGYGGVTQERRYIAGKVGSKLAA